MASFVKSICFIFFVFVCEIVNCYWVPGNPLWSMNSPRIQRGYSRPRHRSPYYAPYSGQYFNAPLSGLPPRSSNPPGNVWLSPLYNQIRYDTAERAIAESYGGLPSRLNSRYAHGSSVGRILNYINSDRVARIQTDRFYRGWPYWSLIYLKAAVDDNSEVFI